MLYQTTHPTRFTLTRLLTLFVAVLATGASPSVAQEQSANAVLEASVNALQEIPGFRAQFKMGGEGGAMFKDTLPSMSGQLFFGTHPELGRVIHCIGEAKDQQTRPSKPIDILLASDRYIWTDNSEQTIYEKPISSSSRGIPSAFPLVLMHSILIDDPYAKDADNAKTIDLLTQEVVGDVLCDVIHIKKNPPSGRTSRSGKDTYTDARWYIGADDKLPRKIEHITDAGLVKITLYFELSNFSVVEPPESMLDVTRPTGFKFKSSMPKVGEPEEEQPVSRPVSENNNTPANPRPQPNQPRTVFAPSFSITPAGQETVVTNSTQADRVTVMYFWGSWCIPCKDVSPLVSAMADDFADEDFDAFAIALREANPSEVESDFEDQHDQLSLVIDDSGIASRFKARVLPTIVVIDRDGVIVYQRGISKDLTGEDLVAAAKTAVSNALSK